MATPMTLREKKFKQLMVKYQEGSNIVPMPCAGLVEFIENGILEGDELEKYLKNKFDIYFDDIAAIVLGCTHYPFIKETLAKVVGSEIPLIDGGAGTSHELQRKLEEKGTISDSKNIGNVEIYNSTNDMKVIDFCYNLINV